MIIDSHVHVWVQQPEKYPWSPVGGNIPKTEAPIEKLLEVMNRTGVNGAVLVQPTPYGWDNHYLLDAVKAAPDRFRAVCLVDPLSPNNGTDMHSLVKLNGVSGFRLNWNLQSIPVWQENPAHLAFWKTANDLGRPICIQCSLEYIHLLKAMCQRFPQVRVVVDHLGRLKTGDGITHPLFQKLLSLSEDPNVYIKISGWYYCSQQPPPYADLRPFLQEVLDSYGVQRCLWGSDFPFIQEHWSYAGLLDYIKQNVSRSEDDLQWLLGKTAWNLWW